MWSDVIDYIEAHSCQWSFDPPADNSNSTGEWGIHQLDDPPHNRLLGPVFPRGDAAGLISVDGAIQCQWGDIHRADMTFSVTKSYLAMTAGIAVMHGLIKDIDQPVVNDLEKRGITAHGFDSEHNRQITWRQFLHFTSEWSGSCFGIPDQIDHYRNVGLQPIANTQRKGDPRPLKTPGTHWEYNDVRINQFSLALMQLFGRELPDVFAEHIAQPVGLSDTWHWHGYENSFVDLNGKRLQSVPGGGHWGGGMVISAHDQWLIGQLMVNNGIANGQQLLPAEWIDEMRKPCEVAPWYGFFTWLNNNHAVCDAIPEDSYFAMGIGGQLVWHDPGRGIVGVFRWIDSEFTSDILGVVEGEI